MGRLVAGLLAVAAAGFAIAAPAQAFTRDGARSRFVDRRTTQYALRPARRVLRLRFRGTKTIDGNGKVVRTVAPSA